MNTEYFALHEREVLDRFEKAGGDVSRPEVPARVLALAAHAPALLPWLMREPTMLEDSLFRNLHLPVRRTVWARRFRKALVTCEESSAAVSSSAAVRRLQHRGLVRIALREALSLGDVDSTSQEMAQLASAAVDAVMSQCVRELSDRWGFPVANSKSGGNSEPGWADGKPIPWVALGMGKLGGGELNLGSDIDLCFFYGTDDGRLQPRSGSGREAATVALPPRSGKGPDSIHAFFAEAVQATTRLLSEVTDEGFAFRVDLRLRPEGASGPLVSSVASAQRYYETWGRPWERAVLLRARPIAGNGRLGMELLRALVPFVYPRSVDPSVAREMIGMVQKARRDLQVDTELDLKHGWGGIREAEFSVQSLQLVWGGRNPTLQVPSTVEALRRLASLGLVSGTEAWALEQAWALLRRVEHRVHMVRGYATHSLPGDEEGLRGLAESLRFETVHGFQEALHKARSDVHAFFVSLDQDASEARRSPLSIQPSGDVGAPPFSRLEALLTELCSRMGTSQSAEHRSAAEECTPWLVKSLEDLGAFEEPMEAASHLLRWVRYPWMPLGRTGLERSPRLGAELFQGIVQSVRPGTALRHATEFLTTSQGWRGYDRFLAAHPILLRQLADLWASSRFLSELLSRREDAFELLAHGGAPLDAQEIHDLHRQRCVEVLGRPGELSEGEALEREEALVAKMRTLKTEMYFRAGLGLASGTMGLTEVQHLLSHTAEAQLDAMTTWIREIHCTPEQPPPVVVALGKLGTREMGFGSDLDLIFFDSEAPVSPPPGAPHGNRNGAHPTRPDSGRDGVREATLRMARKILQGLTEHAAEGQGYAIDTRLRPDGSSGSLVVSPSSFRRYHARRAKTWERMALLRARPVVGSPQAIARTEAALDGALTTLPGVPGVAPQEAAQASDGADVAHLRRQSEVELGQENRNRRNFKYGHGGLFDVELLCQWGALSRGRTIAHNKAAHGMGRAPRESLVDERGTVVRGLTVAQTIEGLAAAGWLGSEDAERLREGHVFLRSVEQFLQLWDGRPHTSVAVGGRSWSQLARQLQFRDRDGMAAEQAFDLAWKQHTESIRRIFEQRIGPVGLPAPWQG